MKSALERAQTSAVRMNDDIGNLFAQVGSSVHPRGFAATAYRNARRAMRSAMVEQNPVTAVRDVFLGLKSTIRSETLGLFSDAQHLGITEAERQLRFYGVEGSEPHLSQQERESANAALAAIMSKLDAQEAQVIAMMLLETDIEQIVGSEERTGVLRESDIITALVGWVATLLWNSFGAWSTSRSGGFNFSKQAVAALDGRTTDCCLRVHGQITSFDGKFHLTGTPRFADYLDWSPFHYRCRTSIALYLPEFDNGLTQAMRESANIILAERAAGGSGDRHPADGYA